MVRVNGKRSARRLAAWLSCLERQIGVSACITIRPSRRCRVDASSRQLHSLSDGQLALLSVHRTQPGSGQFRPSVGQSDVLYRLRSVRDNDDRRHQCRTRLVIHRRRAGFVLCHRRADLSECLAGRARHEPRLFVTQSLTSLMANKVSSSSFVYHCFYLRQEGYVLPGVCLFVARRNFMK